MAADGAAGLTLRAGASATWSTAADIRDSLRKAWNSGRLLRLHASGEAWLPLVLTLRGPTAAELGDDLTSVWAWVADLEGAARGRGKAALFGLERKTVGGRTIGANSVPARARFDSAAQVWRMLGVEQEVRTFDRLHEDAAAVDPRVAEWAATHPLKALDVQQIWTALLRAASWVAQNGGQQRYLREIDAPGVDTKLLERNHAVVSTLFDLILAPEAVNPLAPTRDLAARYGFRTRPVFVRSRMLDGARWICPAVGDCYLQLEDLAALSPPADHVVIVENEISYLSLPTHSRVLAVFGKGYDVARFGLLPWLAERDVIYWGDIDTHGFAILDQLRRQVPHARSMLMDLATLQAHQPQWGREPKPAHTVPTRLTGPEFETLDYLIEHAVEGQPLRLEQERLAFSRVDQRLAEALGRREPAEL